MNGEEFFFSDSGIFTDRALTSHQGQPSERVGAPRFAGARPCQRVRQEASMLLGPGLALALHRGVLRYICVPIFTSLSSGCVYGSLVQCAKSCYNVRDVECVDAARRMRYTLPARLRTCPSACPPARKRGLIQSTSVLLSIRVQHFA